MGLGILDGAEDMILDENDNLYCGSRHGDVLRFFGPDYRRHEVYAHIGGNTLGMAFNSKATGRLRRRHGSLQSDEGARGREAFR